MLAVELFYSETRACSYTLGLVVVVVVAVAAAAAVVVVVVVVRVPVLVLVVVVAVVAVIVVVIVVDNVSYLTIMIIHSHTMRTVRATKPGQESGLKVPCSY